MKRHPLVASFAAAVVASAIAAVPAQAQRTDVLAQGPVAALPPDGSFLSVIRFRQPPGESFTHGHIPGFVYALGGDVTVVAEGSSMPPATGEGHFIPALAVHTHENSANRLAAGSLAIGLVLAVIALVLVAAFSRARGILLPALLVALVAGGAVALWDPWKNDWFFIGVRPESARGGPMPTPGTSRVYESPTLRVPVGPYVESLAVTTVEPGGQVPASESPGAVVLLVLDGDAEVTVGSHAPVRLGHDQATLIQSGESFRVLNPTGAGLRLLSFALAPQESSP